jgi:dTDP-4-amino-4,6-dideoxy-D-galactose acyltransferase
MLKELPWDSDHFGFRVAQIECSDLADGALEENLQVARRNGVTLVYWAADSDRVVPDSLLALYGGTLVDSKLTFGADLARLRQGGRNGETPFAVQEFLPGPATPPLVELGIAAGAYSRFWTDKRIDRERAESLYAIWIDRCARRELADVVLVAHPRDRAETMLGMITVRVQSGLGSIGLIAVGHHWRGQGVGRQLLQAAHDWMAGRGVHHAQVVTQRANEPACKLYRCAGYEVEELRQFYHFWPQADVHR